MQVQEYEKRLATAIRLLGEEAGRRYMAQRLRDLRGDIEHRLAQEVLARLADLTWHHLLLCVVVIGPHGVEVQLARTKAKPPEPEGKDARTRGLENSLKKN